MKKWTTTFAVLFGLTVGICSFCFLLRSHISRHGTARQTVKPFLADVGADKLLAICCYRLSKFYPYHNAGKGMVLYQYLQGEQVNAAEADIRDPKGQKIKITFAADGTMQFSSNADAEFKKLAFSMAKTAIGIEILQKLHSTPTRIVIEINKVDAPLTVDEHYILGQTTPLISIKVDRRGEPKERPYISSARIVLFEVSIKHMLIKNGGKVLMNGETIDLSSFSIADIIASVAVHEATHVLYTKFSGALNPKATKYEIEKKPYENQLQHLKELQKR